MAVGEGFGRDGSKLPGAAIYATTDGHTFKLLHRETVDGSSLMAVKMFSASEHAVGGRLQGGLSMHTADGGKTYVKKGAGVKVPMMITSMSFLGKHHGFATSINNLQICSLLEFGQAPSSSEELHTV